MIKAEEVRIGNWVQYEGGPNMIMGIMSTYDLDTQYRVEINPPDCFDVFIQQLYPLPLTEEWLERFGYNVDDTMYDMGFEFMEDGSVEFYYGNDPSTAKLKYVHQLQNLYFALTGEELKLKR
jgi:hypothetical protein